MPADNFVTVFDVLESGFKDWQLSALGLIFVAIGTVIFLFPQIAKVVRIPYLDAPSIWKRLFRYSFLGFSVLWTAASFFLTYSVYHRHKLLAQENRCSVVEGPVEHFVPMPYTGHADESFTVSGVRFAYSDYRVTDGFNSTSSHGGPINSQSYVRICYDPHGNVILRLAIRDFTGPIADYSKSALFPRQEDIPKVNLHVPPNKVRWYGNLFVVLYLLDFIAILALFRPYLRTFFTLKTTLDDRAIPDTLEPGKKLKLRNSMVYWDKENHTIWIRPRGFNLLQATQLVAKLGTDEDHTLIISRQILFSSGFPFIMALFFWTAYVAFSATFPSNTNGPSAAEFVGFTIVVFLVMGLLRLGTIRRRMEQLFQDALAELEETSSRAHSAAP